MNEDSIFVLDDGGQLRPMAEKPYENEDVFQKLLEDWPELLAGSQMNRAAPRRWILVSREAAVPDSEESAGRWSLDHLFLDQDAIPTLVEVKRSSDTRIRREVVGQMLDYAANIVSFWTIHTVKSKFEARCDQRGIDPARAIADLIEKPSEDEEAIEVFWKSVETNLSAGRVRLLFVADRIPDELDRIVQFLNGQMNPAQVLAVQVKQFAGDGGKVLVPRVLGKTAASERAKSTGPREKREWNETDLFPEMGARHGLDVAGVARDIYEWTVGQGLKVRWGSGKDGSFTAGVEGIAEDVLPPGLFTIYTSGAICPRLDDIRKYAPFDDAARMEELVNRFNEIPGIALSATDKYPTVPLTVLVEGKAAATLKGIFQWVQGELRKAAGKEEQ